MEAKVIPDSPADKPKPRLLDQVHEVLRFKHYSIRTERCYVDWIRRFICSTESTHVLNRPGLAVRSPLDMPR